jgi:RNA polymerase sigma-32 factor
MPNKKPAVFLSQTQEKFLATRWKELDELKDSEEILLAFKPLLMNIVKRYKYYGILHEDLIQEAWLGLCTALCKYDPNRGVRFSSYARWWVNASCQDYVMRNWSIVRVGTTTTHKKLFFQLRYLKQSLEQVDSSYFEPQVASAIATKLKVSIYEVQSMHNRLSQKDKYLDQNINEDSETKFVDLLLDEGVSVESVLIEKEQQDYYNFLQEKFHEFLSEREFDILVKRRIEDPPKTLEEISALYGITKERVRQIEKQVVRKLRKAFMIAGVTYLNGIYS